MSQTRPSLDPTPTRPRPRVRLPRWLLGSGAAHTPLDVALQSVAVLGLVALGGAVVYGTGGLPNAFAHLMYIPVLVAGYYFGVLGAVAAGVAAGIVLGPMSSLASVPGPAQPILAWGTRMAFFVAIGVTANLLFASRNRNRDRLRRSIRELYQAYGRSLQTFASLVAHRDEQTAFHCERVAHNACVVGEALGIGEHESVELYWAGILHDLGKIGIPARILLKPGKLTETEYAQIKKHAALGADILAGISPRFTNIAEGVRSHHEWWDGTGYPRGMKGMDIPLSGRILAVVDVFEAVTSNRPYREPLDTETALDLIRKAAGTHFDPRIVACFLEQHGRGRILVEGDPIPRSGLEDYPLPGYATLAEEAQLG